MREDQSLPFIKKGYLNTCFREPKDLEKNLSICFGDGDVKVEEVNEREKQISIHIENKPYIANRYNRHFIVTYGDNNRGERSRIFPLKIVAIDEVKVAV